MKFPADTELRGQPTVVREWGRKEIGPHSAVASGREEEAEGRNRHGGGWRSHPFYK